MIGLQLIAIRVISVIIGQSAAKHPDRDEGSTTIPKGSRNINDKYIPKCLIPMKTLEKIQSNLTRNSKGISKELVIL